MDQDELNSLSPGVKSERDGELFVVGPCLHGPIRNHPNPRFRVAKTFYTTFDPTVNAGVAKRVDIINTEWSYEEEFDEWVCEMGGTEYDSSKPLAERMSYHCPLRQQCRITSAEARKRGLL